MLHRILGALLIAGSFATQADIAPETLKAEQIDAIPEHALLINTFGENALLFDTDSFEVLS